MKIVFLSFLFLASFSVMGQNWGYMDRDDIAFLFDRNINDSTFNEDDYIFTLGALPSRMECRLNGLSDSLIRLYAKYDVLISLKDSVQKYYVIGNAAGRPVDITPKYALEKYNLILVYTHCTPCKYELEYRDIFQSLYSKKHGMSIEKLVYKIEQEAIEEHNRKYRASQEKK